LIRRRGGLKDGKWCGGTGAAGGDLNIGEFGLRHSAQKFVNIAPRGGTNYAKTEVIIPR